MFAMPLVFAQQLVADRHASFEATASHRRLRKLARSQAADDALRGTRRLRRVPVTPAMVHCRDQHPATPVRTVA